MSRVSTVHGAFDAPLGWTLLEGEGAAEGEVVEGAVRRSIVLYGDLPIEGKSPAEYMELQPTLLAGLFPGFVLVERRTLSDEVWGPWLMEHRIEVSGEATLVQWQVYFFEVDRVGILTATAAADAPGDLKEHLFRATATFGFPERASAEHDQLRDDHTHGDEHHHDHRE